jgi:hypothetical protein
MGARLRLSLLFVRTLSLHFVLPIGETGVYRLRGERLQRLIRPPADDNDLLSRPASTNVMPWNRSSVHGFCG